MINAVLFDLDDTLLDHEFAITRAIARLHAYLNTPEPLENFRDRWQGAHVRHYAGFLRGQIAYEDAIVARVRETIDPLMDAASAGSLFAQYLGWYEEGWQLFADAVPALDALRSMPLGIISNGRASEQRNKLRVSSIHDRFAVVVISEDVGVPKPDSEIFRHACNAMGIRPGDALFVGDQYEIDAIGARRAGLRGVWLDRHKKASCSHELPIIDSLAELVELVRSR